MSWTSIEGDELQRLQNRLEIPPGTAIVEAFTLRTPFYNNGELIKINDGMGAVFMVAAGQGDLSAREYYPLDGQGAKIRAANEAAGLDITRNNAIDYLRFFMAFLRNDDGEPFAIIESLNGFGLINEDNRDRRAPEDMRLVFESAKAQDDTFGFRGYVAFEGQLFGVSMLVHKNGIVEMLGDDPLGLIVRLH